MSSYYPDPGDWERRRPEEVGLDPAPIEAAIEFARTHESEVSKSFHDHHERNPEEGVYGRTIGPLPRQRGDPAGVIIKDGYVVGEWGDVNRPDLAFSVTKSLLSTVGGVAYDQGLIEDVDDRVVEYVRDGGFEYSHNDRITWRQLFQQTSEWEGTLFDKPDRVDRREGIDRDLRDPGTFWEYNDVRINRLSLALLRIFKEPLPRVLKREVMDPIGASDTWQWHGYDNSDVVVDDLTRGQTFKSVSGGGHWGGGFWGSSMDLARFGYLFLNRGRWNGERIVSEEWIDAALTPCDIKPVYGYLWWLNTDRAMWPDAPATSYAAIGYGRNLVWIDPEHDVVVVVRWVKEEGSLGDYPTQNELYSYTVDAAE